MKSRMIYKVPYKAATLILYTKEVVIHYKSEPLNGVSYKFATQLKAIDAFEHCMDLMEHLEKSPKFEESDIEKAHRQALELAFVK